MTSASWLNCTPQQICAIDLRQHAVCCLVNQSYCKPYLAYTTVRRTEGVYGSTLNIMNTWFGDIWHETSFASPLPTIMLAWQLWALLSELLLAATHLKVLLCIGRPIPARELSNKRWTYFLYDLVSPWMSLASIVASRALPMLAATMAVQSSATGGSRTAFHNPVTHMQHKGPASTLQTEGVTSSRNISSLPQDTCSPAIPLLESASAVGSYCAKSQHASKPLAAANSRAAAPAPAPAYQQPKVLFNLPALAQTSLAPAAPSPLQQLLLAFVAAHAALHVYYIASWHTAHSRNVVEMSASSSMKSRAQQFNNLEVLWFFIGTGYDILTHVVISYLLVQSLHAQHYHLLA